jgi:hypothetical protein
LLGRWAGTARQASQEKEERRGGWLGLATSGGGEPGGPAERRDGRDGPFYFSLFPALVSIFYFMLFSFEFKFKHKFADYVNAQPA